METGTDQVLAEKRGAVAWLSINREDRRNALNDAVCAGMIAGLKAAATDSEVRAVIVTGVGTKAFCAGGDLKPGKDGSPFVVDPSEPENPVIRLFRAFEDFNKPVVARVNGNVYGGGVGLLCACDMAVAADHAKIGTPEVGVGLFPMMILGYMLRVIPRRRLMEMCMTGEPFVGHEAVEAGLVNYSVPAAELDAKVDWLLARMVDKSPTAIRLGKHAFHAMQDMSLGECFNIAQAVLPNMVSTEDAKEGFRAFQERRAPNWTGR